MNIEHVQKDYMENIITVQYTGEYSGKLSIESVKKNYPNAKVKLISNNKPSEFQGFAQYGEVIYKCLGGC